MNFMNYFEVVLKPLQVAIYSSIAFMENLVLYKLCLCCKVYPYNSHRMTRRKEFLLNIKARLNNRVGLSHHVAESIFYFSFFQYCKVFANSEPSSAGGRESEPGKMLADGATAQCKIINDSGKNKSIRHMLKHLTNSNLEFYF